LVHGGEQRLEDGDEFIGPSLVPLPISLQGFLTTMVKAPHAFEAHLAEIIKGLCHLSLDAGGRVGIPLRGGMRCIRGAARRCASVAKWCTLMDGPIANAEAP
jgi:hypothetical protein